MGGFEQFKHVVTERSGTGVRWLVHAGSPPAPPPERNRNTISSLELGLQKGDREQLDAVVAHLNREQLALRTTAVLTGLHADLNHEMVNVSHSLAGGLGGEPGMRITNALQKNKAVFIEPLQQLILLRRCLSVATKDPASEWTGANLTRYFDACRYAADVCRSMDQEKQEPGQERAESGLIVAANFLLRMSLMNPVHPTAWIARMRLMLRQLPQEDARAKPWAQGLEDRIVNAFGITFDAVTRFVAMLTLWSLRFKNIGEVFKPDAGIALNLDAWLSHTNILKDDLVKFLLRTARPSDEVLEDDKLGGPLSILPFRDQPFIQFADGGVAPLYPSLVMEKLTYDLFWWAASPEKKQERPWQRDWGDLVELYVVQLLAWIAEKTDCGFKADIKWKDGQVDAAMWFKGHVVLFEISAGMMTDAAAHSGDPEALRDGLYRTLVRSTRDGKDKDEALAQVARDVKALLAGDLKEHLNVGEVIRVYPVVIAIDRRVRVPGLRFWFDKMLNSEVTGMLSRWRVGALAVLTLEGLEEIEQMIRDQHPALNGDPPGLIRLVRQWDTVRDDLPRQKIRAAAWQHFMLEFSPLKNNQRLQAEADKWWAEVKGVFKVDEVAGAPTVAIDTE